MTCFGAGVTDRQARRDLDDLVRAGLLVIEGAGPSTFAADDTSPDII